MNGDGFIELQDLKAIAKSALLAALVLTNQYNLTEEEYARYAKEVRVLLNHVIDVIVGEPKQARNRRDRRRARIK